LNAVAKNGDGAIERMQRIDSTLLLHATTVRDDDGDKVGEAPNSRRPFDVCGSRRPD
jgi:hypothetical protein